ncbi:MAG: helix-turn-helix domain-containing protein [Gammaproteobacteria bacterium]|nr:helix-turn-helix domain-containing protein [Gammaproteobacteria bacterium]
MSTYLPDKGVFRPEEMAEIFQVSIRTVYRWCDEGIIDSIKHPKTNTVRIERSAIVEYLKNGDRLK